MAQLVCPSITIIYNILSFSHDFEWNCLSGIAKGVDFNLVCLWVFVCLFNPCVLFGFWCFWRFFVLHVRRFVRWPMVAVTAISEPNPVSKRKAR